jgi:cellulose synthase/poly-beta-1,6-N-acetylglucosamine synthase-like glycosyltransferase
VLRKASLFSLNKSAFKVSSSFLYFIIGSFFTLLYFIYCKALKMSFPFIFSKNESHKPCLAVFIIKKYLFLANKKALWL